jgi:hypothetical protein
VTNVRAADDDIVLDGVGRPDQATAAARDELLTLLVGLLPAQFDEVLLRAQIPLHYLSAGAQTTRAIEAIRYADQQGNLDQVARIVGAVIVTAHPATRPDAVIAAAPQPVSRPARAERPLAVAAVTGVTALGLLLLMLRGAQTLGSVGLTGHVWYVLLVLLGLSAAVTVFSLFKSCARYTGKALGATLELGGLVVIMLVTIVLGFAFAPRPAQRFDLTVFLHSEAGRQVVALRNRGSVSLDLGADKRTEAVGDKGEARFVGIPADLRGLEAALSLVDDSYELVDPALAIRLDQEAVYTAIRPRRRALIGYITEEHGRPLPRARATIGGFAATTDQDGRFELMLPIDLPEGERLVTVTASGYDPWHAQAVPGGNVLRARLTPSRDSPY